MELACITFVVILHSIRYAFGNPGDPVMYLPPFEVRTMSTMNNRQNMIPFESRLQSQFAPQLQSHLQPQLQSHLQPQLQSHLQPQLQPHLQSQLQQFHQDTVPQQQILHTSIQAPSRAVSEKPYVNSHNFTFNELVEALNEVSNHEEHDKSRSVEKDHESTPYPTHPYPAPSYPASPYPAPSYPRPYGAYSSRPSYGPPPPYQPAPAYVPPTAVHHAASKTLSPELASLFLKPVTTKVASKVSGLLGLVLSLFSGSSAGGSELKGFKEIVIDGILKPLLIAKGGIKSLISKLTIPVISLLLINLEVLITVWWLWDDCPEPVHSPPPYAYPKPSY